MNKKGSASLLALVLSMAVLPAAGVLVYIAQSDLASSLDDYHYTKYGYAARAVAVVLASADLLKEGTEEVIWPDPDVIFKYILPLGEKLEGCVIRD